MPQRTPDLVLRSCLYLSLWLCVDTTSRAADVRIDRFLEAYRPASDALFKRHSQIDIAWVSEFQGNNPLARQTQEGARPHVRLVVDGEKTLLERSYEKPYRAISISLISGESYELARIKENKNFSISSTPLSKAALLNIDKVKQEVAFAPFSMGLMKLHSKLRDPAFKITSLEQHDTLTTVAFEHSSNSSKEKDRPKVTSSGWFTVDSRLGYAITEYELKFQADTLRSPHFHEKAKLKYQDHTPVLTLAEIEKYPIVNKTDLKITKQITRITQVRYGPTDPTIFSLSHYGLGDAEPTSSLTPRGGLSVTVSMPATPDVPDRAPPTCTFSDPQAVPSAPAALGIADAAIAESPCR